MCDFFSEGPSELYILTKRQAMVYRRFDTAALAIRYAMEKIPSTSLVATTLEVNEMRYDHKAIRELYESESYPLPRCA